MGALRFADQLDELLQRERDVADDRVAHRRARCLVGIVRDGDERRALGQQRPGDVRVIREHVRADHEQQVVVVKRLRQRTDRGREDAEEVRVVFREADPAARRPGRRPYR
jgi:hypothetical protein